MVNFSNLSCHYKCFASTLTKSFEPRNYKEAVIDPKWVDVMNNEIQALHRNNTWDVVDRPKKQKFCWL